MTVTVAADGVVRLAGACPVEDAEALLQHLLANQHAPVDWTECESAHTAVVQVLLVARSVPVGTPMSGFLRDYVGPLLTRVAS